MKTHYLYLAGSLLLGTTILSACSSSEPDGNNLPVATDNAIRFSASTEKTRADATTDNLKSFTVYSYLTGKPNKPYMERITVNKEGNAWVYSPVQYWPATPLDFYAYSPASFVSTASTPLGSIEYHNGSGTEDLIYAVSLNQSQPSLSGQAQVLLNFRHALSKVDINLSSASDDLIVKVSQVYIIGVNMNGDFHFPKADTTGQADENNTGYWDNLSYQYAYPILMAQDQSEVLQLTTTPVNANQSGYFAQYMIPQSLTWKNNGDLADDYIMLSLSIYDADTGAKVWPNKNTPDDQLTDGSTNNDGKIKFPLSGNGFTAWTPGYHYVYNIKVNGHPDLEPIEFGTPTVDGFVDVTTNYEF